MAQWNDRKSDPADAETSLTDKINCALVVEDEFLIAEGLKRTTRSIWPGSMIRDWCSWTCG
jgi:hypothetical protein